MLKLRRLTQDRREFSELLKDLEAGRKKLMENKEEEKEEEEKKMPMIMIKNFSNNIYLRKNSCMHGCNHI